MKAAALARDGRADLLMKGFVDTSLIMKAVLSRENELRRSSTISHDAVMEVPGYDRLLHVTDSAMNIAPTLEQKAAILENAVEVAHAKKAGVMMGARVPIVLTSRATSADSKMYSIALGVVIALHMKENAG